MSNITVNIPFEDRNLWIKRIDQRIQEADGASQKLFRSHLEAYNAQVWLVRWFLGPAPTLDMAQRQALNGVLTLKILKDMLQTSGWKTMNIDGWIFRWLKGYEE